MMRAHHVNTKTLRPPYMQAQAQTQTHKIDISHGDSSSNPCAPIYMYVYIYRVMRHLASSCGLCVHIAMTPPTGSSKISRRISSTITDKRICTCQLLTLPTQ